LKTFLDTSSQNVQWGSYYRDQITFAFEATTDKSPAPLDYSTTNIQVAGVDEIDVVKTDGEFLYIVSGKSIYIVRAHPWENAGVLSRLDFNEAINGLFVSDDKLVLLTGAFTPYRIGFIAEGDSTSVSASTTIMIYDIANRSTPTLDRNMTVNGSYFNSRMIADYVYVIITQPAYVHDGEVALPAIIDDDHAVTIPATNIYYSNVSDYYYAFTNILTRKTLTKKSRMKRS
jgi:uncharacterized secreted protein with C-terminal beta-propeller domain